MLMPSSADMICGRPFSCTASHTLMVIKRWAAQAPTLH